jgi:hypothetical protein
MTTEQDIINEVMNLVDKDKFKIHNIKNELLCWKSHWEDVRITKQPNQDFQIYIAMGQYNTKILYVHAPYYTWSTFPFRRHDYRYRILSDYWQTKLKQRRKKREDYSSYKNQEFVDKIKELSNE